MDYNISMVRGDTVAFGVEILDGDGELFTQDLETAYFTCKVSYETPSIEGGKGVIFHKKLGDGISKLDTGQYVVRVSPADTDKAQAGKYYYDLELGLNGDVFTFLKGVLEIEHDVTDYNVTHRY